MEQRLRREREAWERRKAEHQRQVELERQREAEEEAAYWEYMRLLEELEGGYDSGYGSGGGGYVDYEVIREVDGVVYCRLRNEDLDAGHCPCDHCYGGL